MTTNPLITEARRLRAACDENELALDIACLELNSEPESKLLTFAANNILEFADKIEELDAECNTIGLLNAEFAAKIKDQEKEIAEVHGYLGRLLTSIHPSIELLPDLLGLSTQVDHVLSGLRTKDEQIAALQSALDDADGQLGEFFNTPSGAIIKALQAQVEELHLSRNHLFETVKQLRVRDANALTVIEQLRARVSELASAK